MIFKNTTNMFWFDFFKKMSISFHFNGHVSSSLIIPNTKNVILNRWLPELYKYKYKHYISVQVLIFKQTHIYQAKRHRSSKDIEMLKTGVFYIIFSDQMMTALIRKQFLFEAERTLNLTDNKQNLSILLHYMLMFMLVI